MPTKIGERAVVLGASMAGLLAARVLADAYEQVTVVERDPLPDEPVHRRGVPQGRHAHAVLARGGQLLDELFDGLFAELIKAGAVADDGGDTVMLAFSGYRLAPVHMGVDVLFVSRRLLECGVRGRVRKIPGITILDNTDAVGVVPSDDRQRIVGVRVAGRSDPEREQVLASDLVVDATGRGSRVPAWLAQLGFPVPRRERIEVDVHYSTRIFRLREGALGRNHAVLIGPAPPLARLGALFTIEGGVHICSLSGVLGDTPPTDLPGFLAFAASLPFPDVHDAIVGAEPLDDGARFGYPANVRLRYEEMRQHPAGLIVIGDALCALNPVYGQGMTVAMMQAAALRRLLEDGPVSPDRYFSAAAKETNIPWETATAADLLRNKVTGMMGARLRVLDSYLTRLHAAATTDPELTLAFLNVVGLLDPPSKLMRPRVVAKVLRGGRRSQRVATPVSGAVPSQPREDHVSPSSTGSGPG